MAQSPVVVHRKHSFVLIEAKLQKNNKPSQRRVKYWCTADLLCL